MAYKELMELGKDEVERLSKLYEKEVISVSCSKNYQTGETFYHEPVPEGAIPVCYFSNATHFLRMTPTFEKLSNGLEPLNQVMKLIECNGRPVAKISDTEGKLMCRDAEYVEWLKRTLDWRLTHG